MKIVIRKILSEIGYREITIFLAFVFIMSILPMVYCAFFAYASSDDMWNAYALKRVVAHNGTFSDAVQALKSRYINSYNGWAGNWVSIFVWMFCPSIWGERLYTIVPLSSMASIIIGNIFPIRYFVRKYITDNPYAGWIISILICGFTFQFMPTVRSGIYMYTVVTNYIIPYAILLISFIWIDMYVEKGNAASLILLSLVYGLLGGVGYPVLVFGAEIIMIVIVGLFILAKNKRKRAFGLMTPFVLFLIGFYFNVKSPGNAIRGGDNYTFGLAKVFETIFKSITTGCTTFATTYMKNRPLVFAFIIIFVIAYETISVSQNDDADKSWGITYKYPYIVLPLMLLIYCGTYAPQIYSRDEIFSGGVPNTIFFVLMITCTVSTIYLAGFCKRVYKSKINVPMIRNSIILCIIIIGLLGSRFLIGESTDYMIYRYISEGHLTDFRHQMEEQISLLTDPNTTDVVLKPINEDQGPYMYMPATDDPTAYTNMVLEVYYEKNSVIVESE